MLCTYAVSYLGCLSDQHVDTGHLSELGITVEISIYFEAGTGLPYFYFQCIYIFQYNGSSRTTQLLFLNKYGQTNIEQPK